MTMNYTMNHKIANSGCQGQIEDDFWEILRKNPLDFFIEDQIDDVKLKETYKSCARNLGVRIY